MHRALSLLCGLALAGAASAQPSVQPDYLVGPTDVVQIAVFDESELTGPYTVDASGTITFPMIGRVPVDGLTLREIQEEVTRQLGGGFLINPQVTVEIQDFRSQSVLVLGEVSSPGIYQLSGNVSLIEVLALAGGVTAQAGNALQIVRPSVNSTDGVEPEADDDSETEITTVSLDEIRTGRAGLVTLRDGDRVNVPKSAVFFVTGHVGAPGSYVWTEGITIEQAVALAGGYTNRGSDRGIRVRRLVEGEPAEVGVHEEDLVQPDDTVHIRPRRF